MNTVTSMVAARESAADQTPGGSAAHVWRSTFNITLELPNSVGCHSNNEVPRDLARE